MLPTIMDMMSIFQKDLLQAVSNFFCRSMIPGAPQSQPMAEDKCFSWINIDLFNFHRFVGYLLLVLFNPPGLIRDAGCKDAERQAAAVGYRDILKIAE